MRHSTQTLYELDRHAGANDRRRPPQAAERDVVLGIEEPVNLSAARLYPRGHPATGSVSESKLMN